MGFVVAVLLAIFVLDSPWNWVAVGTGAAWELAETVVLIRWSQRRSSAVGTEALLGRKAVVTAACMPDGQVRVAGELWRAHCRAGAATGDEVVVRAVEGLTLEVEHA